MILNKRAMTVLSNNLIIITDLIKYHNRNHTSSATISQIYFGGQRLRLNTPKTLSIRHSQPLLGLQITIQLLYQPRGQCQVDRSPLDRLKEDTLEVTTTIHRTVFLRQITSNQSTRTHKIQISHPITPPW